MIRPRRLRLAVSEHLPGERLGGSFAAEANQGGTMSSRRITRTRLGTIFICAGLAAGLCASPALAKKKKGLGGVVAVTAVSQGGTTTQQPLSATATCPKGRKAFGGGFSAVPTDQTSLIFVEESHRSGARSWVAAGTFFAISGTPTPLAITTTVYCRRLAKAPKEVTTSVPVLAATNNVPFTAIARCQGKGQKLISGGYRWTPSANGNLHQALIYENQPSGKTWRASVQNSGTAPARTLTSYAYCAKGLKAAAKISTGSNAADVPSALSPLSASSAACPKKTRMSATGFVSPFPATTPMTARPLYTQSAISGTASVASLVAGFGGGPLTLTALGLCT
jgi:hypothetical protein